MDNNKNIWLSWSSGKDSAWTLHTLLKNKENVTALFTTVNEEFERVAMHAVRLELLKMQAEAIGLPLHVINIPWPCSNEKYEAAMGKFVEMAKEEKVTHFAFGDLYLEDVRDYRIDKLKDTGIEPYFPIWLQGTKELSRKVVDEGIKTVLTCINPKQMPMELAGSLYTHEFLDKLPEEIDPCGENGEFHTFVYDSPDFKYPLDITVGETVERDGFVFTDVTKN